MVAPVTGPFASNLSSFALAWSKQTWKQAKPIDRPLPYSFQGGRVRLINGSTLNLSSIASNIPVMTLGGAHIAAAQLQAYERLRGQISERALLGAAIAEMGQSCLMIYSRMKQIVDLIRAIKKLDVAAVGNVLEASVVRKPGKDGTIGNVRWTKSFANNWLEFSFGWVPLIGDVFAAMDVLQSPIKSIRPKATGSSGPIKSSTTSGSKPSGFYTEDTYNLWARCKTGCEVTINNPNLFLLNNLGLANPGTVIWEIIPFSFVIDYFATVNAFLSSGTDFLGLGISNAYNTITMRGNYYQDRRNPFNVPPVNNYFADVSVMQRGTTLYSSPITIRPMTIPNWRRAANQAATAVQLLSIFGGK